jgi:hypothetical protein
MAKYYIKCGTLEIIYSCNKCPTNAATDAIWETNENDILDEYFYIDERGYRDYTSADKTTIVLPTERILKESGWSVE